MPPKLKVGKKGKKKGKGKKGKGKKGKKIKKLDPALPLHNLTTLYNLLREKAYDIRRIEGKVKKKRIEGWYMTREMLNLKHDNQLYHEHLQHKMDQLKKIIAEIEEELAKEKEYVDRMIAQKIAEMNKKMAEYRDRIAKGEVALNELKLKLLEFEPLIKKLAALMARLKELEAQIPGAELEANIKTRHLKNQYLNQRAEVHNYLEAMLYELIMTCRAHLMPILSDHMNQMEADNSCNRWDLRRLDVANFDLSLKKERLLEKRNTLNMEKGYLGMDWVFVKLANAEAKRKAQRKAEREAFRMRGKIPPPPEECELSVIFTDYLSKALVKERLRQKKEERLRKIKEEKLRKQAIEEEKVRKKAEKEALEAKRLAEEWALEEYDEDEEEEYDEWDEMEYYEDEDGNIIMAPAGRMLEHKAIMENRDMETDADTDDFDDDYKSRRDRGEGSEGSLGSYSGSSSSSSSFSGESADDTPSAMIDPDYDDDDYDTNAVVR